VVKEIWGKGDSVPDKQVFKLNLLKKSDKYQKSKMKIKIKKKMHLVSAWGDGASPEALIPTESAEKKVSRHPTRLKTLGESHLKRVATLGRLPSGLQKRPEKRLPKKRLPTFYMPSDDNDSARAKRTQTYALAPDENGIGPDNDHASGEMDELYQEGQNFYVPGAELKRVARSKKQEARSTKGTAQEEPKKQDIPDSRKKHGRAATYRFDDGAQNTKLARMNTKDMTLVGTAHADGTVETKRRWFCCIRRSPPAAVQQAVESVMHKQEEGIDKALTEVLRDRVRRSHRNARFHRARGVTPGTHTKTHTHIHTHTHTHTQHSRSHKRCRPPRRWAGYG
jgi:hypothetical protein